MRKLVGVAKRQELKYPAASWWDTIHGSLPVRNSDSHFPLEGSDTSGDIIIG